MFLKGIEQQLRHWNAIKDKFKAHFHPLGTTKEQRIKAWKDMRWDPAKEEIDDFTYKYKELGQSLVLNEISVFDNFKACIPGQYFSFIFNTATMTEAVDNLKKCLAAGAMIPTTNVNSTSGTTWSTTQKDDKLKFMAMTEELNQEIFTQIQDTIDERLGPMKEGMYEPKDMINQMYQIISQGQQNQGQIKVRIKCKIYLDQTRINSTGVMAKVKHKDLDKEKMDKIGMEETIEWYLHIL